MAERIQMRRTKGWRMPPNTTKVDRSTVWGNPFAVGESISRDDDDLWPYIARAVPGGVNGFTSLKVTSRQFAVDLFSCWFVEQPALMIRAFEELPGRNLACWCPLPKRPGDPDVCHGAWLLGCVNGLEDGDD